MGSARRAFEWFQNAPAGGGRKPVVRPYDYGFVGEFSGWAFISTDITLTAGTNRVPLA